MLRLIWESVSQCNSHKMYKTFWGTKLFNLTPNIKSWPNIKFLIGLNQNHCCIATNHKFSSEKEIKHSVFRNLTYFKAPSRYARILSLCCWVKQWPMACSVSWTRLRKRSRSRAISSQCPLREAWRANCQVRMTWTWTRGENRTFLFWLVLTLLSFVSSGSDWGVCPGLFQGTSVLSGWEWCFNCLSGREGLVTLDFRFVFVSFSHFLPFVGGFFVWWT